MEQISSMFLNARERSLGVGIDRDDEETTHFSELAQAAPRLERREPHLSEMQMSASPVHDVQGKRWNDATYR